MASFVRYATNAPKEYSYYNINMAENSYFNISVIGKTYPDNLYSISHSGSSSHAVEVIISGKQIMESNGKKLIASEGDCVIIKQKAKFTSASDPNNPVKKTWICMRGDLMDFLYQMYSIHDDVTVIKADLKDEFESFYKELFSGNGLSDAGVKVHSIIQRLSQAQKEEKCSQQSALSSKLMHILNDNIFGEVSLDSIAKQFFVSKVQLIRSFKKDYGLTPYRYFLLKKIELAKDFLESSDYPLKRIAETLGFSDEQYFCRIFKSIVGISPGKYRKM